MEFFLVFLGMLTNLLPEFFVTNQNIVFLGKCTHLGDDTQGINHIHCKYTEKHSHHKGKCQIVCEPLQRIENVRMYKEIVNSSQNSPVNGKLKAYYTLKVKLFIGIIP